MTCEFDGNQKKRGPLAVFKVAGGLKTELGGQFETCFVCWKWWKMVWIWSRLKLADISVCFNLHIFGFVSGFPFRLLHLRHRARKSSCITTERAELHGEWI